MKRKRTKPIAIYSTSKANSIAEKRKLKLKQKTGVKK